MSQYPSSDEHLAFLVKLQRLMSEGDFTATYKFALLLALADIAVERGHDDSRPMNISMRDIAEKFIDYYWQQTMPYGPELPRGTDQGSQLLGAATNQPTVAVLSQNMGATAKVVSDIQQFRAHSELNTLGRAKQSRAFNALVQSVAQTVAAQPVTYFHNVAGGADAFVYDRIRAGVRLKDGVSSHLRKFHGLIQHMARDRWVRHIKSNKRNTSILGRQDDLHGFLFETNRASLDSVRVNLAKLFNKRCFYCGGGISDTPDVDHFIPFSVYGRDIAQNFVLAHGACNRSKSDVLAAKRHIDHWLEQLNRNCDDISQIGLDAGIVSNAATIRSVARWSYQAAYDSGAHAWLKKGRFEPISDDYLGIGF